MLKQLQKSILFKINALVIASFLLVILTVGYLSVGKIQEVANEQMHDFSIVPVILLKNRIEDNLNIISTVSEKIANEVKIFIANSNDTTLLLKLQLYSIERNIQAIPGFTSMGIFIDSQYVAASKNKNLVSLVSYASESGKNFLQIITGFDYEKRNWYQKAKQQKQAVWSEKPRNLEFAPQNVKIVSYSIPIYLFEPETAAETFVGVISFAINISLFENILEIYSLNSKDSYCLLVSKDSTIVEHPINDFIGKKIENDTNLARINAIKKVSEQNSSLIFDKNDNLRIIVKALPLLNWNIIAVLNQSIMANTKNKLSYHLILIWLLAMFVFGALVLYFINKIVSPLRALSNSLTLIDKNNHPDMMLPQINSNDEVAVVANSLHRLINALIDTKNQLSDALIQINLFQKQKELSAEQIEELVEERTTELSSRIKLLDMSLENLNVLNELGQIITSSLSLSEISMAIFDRMKLLLPVDVFGIFVYNQKENLLLCEHGVISGRKLKTVRINIADKSTIATRCFDSRQPITINNFDIEYQEYVLMYNPNYNAVFGYKPVSLFYAPLMYGDEILGIFTVQGFNKGIFRNFNLDILNSLTTYLNISIKNILSYENLQKSLEDLNRTQSQLIRNEKMASLGQLMTGVAHEIKNPLNFVINFSELSLPLIKDFKDFMNELDEKEIDYDRDYFAGMIEDMDTNLHKINEHSKRADGIVRGMLQHSRSRADELSLIDINNLVSEYAKLSYYGLRASDSNFQVKIVYNLDPKLGQVRVIQSNMSRVILNLVGNACQAAFEKSKTAGNNFEPTVTVTTIDAKNDFILTVKDNGIGIPDKNKNEIFMPFFTTKTPGQGTGLGLSICYEIVTKEHHGEISFESEENKFTEFKIIIPKQLNN